MQNRKPLDNTTCPICGSGQIEGGFVEIVANGAYQDTSCECGAVWTDRYVLASQEVESLCDN